MTSPSTSGLESSEQPVSPAYSSFLDPPLQQLLLIEPPPSFIAKTRMIMSSWHFGTFLALLGFIFVMCLYLLHVIAFCYVRYRLYRPVVPNPSLPGVSIIKPIIGTDKNLYENVETFFTSQYHQFEILFCFNSTDDAAVEVVESLMRKYPMIDAQMFFNGEKVGLNPKINNMMPAYRAARYPLIMISDSAIFMRQEALLDMATTIMSQEKLALVTQTPYCKDREGFDAQFEQVYFGTSHGRIYLSGNCMEFVCPTGMSSMVKRNALEECGGLAKFGGFLAEDYFIGRELANRGYKSTVSSLPALQNNASVSISSFINRICRWVKLRTAMLPHIVLVEPLQDCFPAGLILACSLHYLADIDMYSTFCCHILFWIAMDYMLMHKIQNGKLSMSPIRFLLIWLLRELSTPIVFIKAAFDPRIHWRNNVFHLAWGGRIVRKST